MRYGSGDIRPDQAKCNGGKGEWIPSTGGTCRQFYIRVLYMLGVGPILQMGFDELAFLFAIMTHIATEEMRSYNSRVIRDILAILTCVLELAIETSPGT